MSKKANLKELVDFDELQSIQNSFAKTVGTSSVIFSPEGEPLTRFSNPTSFCSLIQTTEEGRRRCFLSFMEMSRKALELKESNILYCFAHGGHFVAPIIINGEHKGTMFAGQFIPQKFSDEQLSEIRRIAEEINIDPELLAKEAKGMRVVGEEEVWNYSSLLFQIVVLIARLGAQAAEMNRAKNKLQKAHDELEMRVDERTAELAKSNEELKQSEKKYRGLVEDVSNTIQIWETDAKGVYTYVSPSTKWVYGYSPEKVIGKTPFDFMPREEAKKIKKEFAKIAKQRKTFEDLINPAKHRGGKILIMETSGTPVFDENNQFVGYRGTARDITKRKKAENALREVQERLAVTLKSIGDGVIATDIEGRITVMNDAAQELTGWKIDEAMGQLSHEILNIVNEETRNPIDDPVVEVLHSGNVVGLGNHSVLIAKDGTERAIADSGAPITAFDGTRKKNARHLSKSFRKLTGY
jgi:PAS domain S-box-containing protein